MKVFDQDGHSKKTKRDRVGPITRLEDKLCCQNPSFILDSSGLFCHYEGIDPELSSLRALEQKDLLLALRGKKV